MLHYAQFLVSGCADGFIEVFLFAVIYSIIVAVHADAGVQVWNPDTGKLCKDLKFQAEEQAGPFSSPHNCNTTIHL